MEDGWPSSKSFSLIMRIADRVREILIKNGFEDAKWPPIVHEWLDGNFYFTGIGTFTSFVRRIWEEIVHLFILKKPIWAKLVAY